MLYDDAFSVVVGVVVCGIGVVWYGVVWRGFRLCVALL